MIRWINGDCWEKKFKFEQIHNFWIKFDSCLELIFRHANYVSINVYETNDNKVTIISISVWDRMHRMFCCIIPVHAYINIYFTIYYTGPYKKIIMNCWAMFLQVQFPLKFKLLERFYFINFILLYIWYRSIRFLWDVRNYVWIFVKFKNRYIVL